MRSPKINPWIRTEELLQDGPE
jgi:hypothetical protein